MRIDIKGFITCKDAERFSDCADHYAFNVAAHRFAISDGVTRSFFPKVWSRILVEQFVALDGATNFGLEACQAAWFDEVSKIALDPNAKWFTRNAFLRNEAGMATLVTLSLQEEEMTWEAKALGDSFLFFIPEDAKEDFARWTKLSSKQDPINFDNYPDYLASRGIGKGESQTATGPLEAGTFCLMTDALSEWMFNDPTEALSFITEEWTDQAHFETSIKQLRDTGLLHDDDSSLLIIKAQDDGLGGISYGDINITDLDERIEMEKAMQKCKNAMEALLTEADDRLNTLLQTFNLTDNARQLIKEQLAQEYALAH